MDDSRFEFASNRAIKYAIKQGLECGYCEEDMLLVAVWHHPRLATVDHRKAVAKGGKNTNENLIGACRMCNLMKSDMTEALFRYKLANNNGDAWLLAKLLAPSAIMKWYNAQILTENYEPLAARHEALVDQHMRMHVVAKEALENNPDFVPKAKKSKPAKTIATTSNPPIRLVAGGESAWNIEIWRLEEQDALHFAAASLADAKTLVEGFKGDFFGIYPTIIPPEGDKIYLFRKVDCMSLTWSDDPENIVRVTQHTREYRPYTPVTV